MAAPLKIQQNKLHEVNEIDICKDITNWLPNVDLNHLPEDQRVSKGAKIINSRM